MVSIRHVGSGELLYAAGERGHALRMLSGVVRLDGVDEQGQPQFMQLALAGDHLRSFALSRMNCLNSARALVPCQVIRVHEPPTSVALAQHWQRAAQALQLRSGTIPERLKRLLLLLSGATPDWDAQRDLPTLRDMAGVIDTSPETVSRILGQLRRQQVLAGRQRQTARFDHERLRHCVLPPGMTSSVPEVRAAN